jgi:23S rRNA (guanosine2251-2'-O)-methyltransferase
VQLEGRQSVYYALKTRQRRFEVVLIKEGSRPERIADILAETGGQGIPVKFVSNSELDDLAFGKSHGGIIAICSRKPLKEISDLEEILRQAPGQPLLVILEGVEDSQHLGYVLRSAESLGAHALILKKHLWNFDETAVSRASSGSFERLPLVKMSEARDLRYLDRFAIKRIGCIAGAKRTIYDADLTGPVALAIGGEKRGLSGKVREECHLFVRIPMRAGSASSLSLTHAACLLVGEAFRQRYANSAPVRSSS